MSKIEPFIYQVIYTIVTTVGYLIMTNSMEKETALAVVIGVSTGTILYTLDRKANHED